MNFDVDARTIYLATHGSHAYGLSTPSSDHDIKGVCIEPKEFHFGYLHTFEQHEAMANKGHPEDKVVYSLKKFMKLAADCNPNIIEVLFCDESDIIKMDEFGKWLRDIRHEFLSKKAKFTFSGYAHAQLKRIKTHRAWLLNPPASPPTRKEFGLSETSKVSKSDLGAYDGLLDQGMQVELPKDIVTLFAKEKSWQAAKQTWEQYENWKKTRNVARAALEEQFGYDCKHGSHLLRLMRMCKEILEGKGVIVKRPDRDELLAVKQGRVPYDQLIEEATTLEKECDVLYETSTLKKIPDHVLLNEQCCKMIEEYVKDYG